MKHHSALIASLIILASLALGCGSLNPLSGKKDTSSSGNNKTTTDKTVDTVVGDEKIGIPECDEAMDIITSESNDPNDGYVTKAVKATFFNKIKEQIKKAVEESKKNSNGSTVEVQKTCRDFRDQLLKYKAEEDKKKQQDK